MKPCPNDRRHHLRICDAQLRELRRHVGSMAEAYGLDRKIAVYMGARPITLYRWDLECLLDVIEMAFDDKQAYLDHRALAYQVLKELGERLRQEYESAYPKE